MSPFMRWLALLTMVGAIFAGCATPTSPASAPAAKAPPGTTPSLDAPRYGGVLPISTVADPPSLDVNQEATMLTSTVLAPAYNKFFEFGDAKKGQEIVPSLMEKWEVSPDGLTYTFYPRKGVKFHDGKPFTIDDAVFSLRRLVNPPKGIISNLAAFLKPVKSVDASGDTLKVSLEQPFPPLIPALAHDYTVTFPKHVVEEKGDMKKTVVGTGPFKFKSYTPGATIELVKNSEYWVPGLPYLDGVTFVILKDRATRLAAFRTGKVKRTGRIFFGGMTPSEVETLKNNMPNLQFFPGPSTLGPWVYFNQKVVPFSDVRVRKAMSLVLDRQAAVKILAEGQGSVGSVFRLEGWGLTEQELAELPGWRQPKDADIAEAKRLLAEAGYPNGFDMVALSRTMAAAKDAAVFATGEWSKIGIRAKVEILEDAVFWDRGNRRAHQVMVFTPGATLPDAQWLSQYIVPGGRLNYSANDDDKKIVDMWDKQLRMVDIAQRKQAIKEIERYVLTESILAAPICWPTTFIGAWPEVRGIVIGVTDYGANNLESVWLAK